MARTLWTLCLGLAAVVLWVPQPALAQAPAAPTPTLWRFLGIPQAFGKINAQVFNRRGNMPGMESKPPLKRLADPANLAPDMPKPIQAAAKIKQAEDLAPQKKKAIKYLASIGCGCYDKKGEVTEALVAAMGDCTESVRLEAVQAIMTAASEDPCCGCGSKCCCNQTIMKKLAEMAYERGDDGCFVEPSEEVRQEAAQALSVCCSSQEPVEIVPQESTPSVVPYETQPPATSTENGTSDAPANGTDDGAPQQPANGTDDSAPQPPDNEPTEAKGSAVSFSLSAFIDTGNPPSVKTETAVAVATPAVTQTIQERPAPKTAPVVPKRGYVTFVNTREGTARVKFESLGEVPEGMKVKAYHKFLMTTAEVGDYVVVAKSGSETVIRKADGGNIDELSRGDTIVVR